MSTDHTDSGETREIDRSAYGKAPRITPEVIEDHITSEHYFTAAQGAYAASLDEMAGSGAVELTAKHLSELPAPLSLLTFCVLVLRNGFTVVGTSACASPANFSQEIGNRVARGDAVNKIWPLLGYALRDQLHANATIGDADVGEALTMLTAHRLGNPEALSPAHADIILKAFTVDEGEEGGKTKHRFEEELAAGPVTGPVK